MKNFVTGLFCGVSLLMAWLAYSSGIEKHVYIINQDDDTVNELLSFLND